MVSTIGASESARIDLSMHTALEAPNTQAVLERVDALSADELEHALKFAKERCAHFDSKATLWSRVYVFAAVGVPVATGFPLIYGGQGGGLYGGWIEVVSQFGKAAVGLLGSGAFFAYAKRKKAVAKEQLSAAQANVTILAKAMQKSNG